MATYVTGDVHGSIDIEKLSPEEWPEGDRLGGEDRVVICGDFGLIWQDPPDPDDEWWLKWLERRPWGETLFVDGNHENHDMLDWDRVERWYSGHHHRDVPLDTRARHAQLYRSVVRLGDYSTAFFKGNG